MSEPVGRGRGDLELTAFRGRLRAEVLAYGDVPPMSGPNRKVTARPGRWRSVVVVFPLVSNRRDSHLVFAEDFEQSDVA